MGKVKPHKSRPLELRQIQAIDPRVEEATKSAADWNALLNWARKMRGPQWDSSTSMYHTALESPEHYEGVEPDLNAPTSATTDTTSHQPQPSHPGGAPHHDGPAHHQLHRAMSPYGQSPRGRPVRNAPRRLA